VKALEQKARALGYTELVLETRKVNTAAVAFYRKLGYVECANYGKYVGREEAVCMSKWMLYKAKLYRGKNNRCDLPLIFPDNYSIGMIKNY
jgi:ribosomal protein S18 acetylase RimI-like enzyme